MLTYIAQGGVLPKDSNYKKSLERFAPFTISVSSLLHYAWKTSWGHRKGKWKLQSCDTVLAQYKHSFPKSRCHREESHACKSSSTTYDIMIIKGP